MAAPRKGHSLIQFSIPTDLDLRIEQEVAAAASSSKSEVVIKALCQHFGLNVVEFNPHRLKNSA